jgi:short-subunit dehydrogenase
VAKKLVLVTGASSGLGEATAKLYAARGARVLLLARNEERLASAAGVIRQAGGSAAHFAVDLADAEAVAALAARVGREEGVPDILINNAGAGRWLTLLETSAGEALRMIEVPYLAAFNLTRDLLPGMLARGSGAIACVTSPASYVVWPHAVAYTAARHAMAGFTEALRAELRGKGIAVTLAVLGLVESDYWAHNPGSRDHLPALARLAPSMMPDDAARAIVAGVDAGKRRVVRPGILRALFLLNALAPRLTARLLRRRAKPDRA